MSPKFILTADDYGPVEFINIGIRKLVNEGKINSVQVFSNWGSMAELKSAMVKLAEAVPVGSVLDIGMHLTLTSGKPLLDSRKANPSETWGGLVKNYAKKGEPEDWAFNSFAKFRINYLKEDSANQALYQQRRAHIAKEFEMQLARLENALRFANAKFNAPRLELTSLSCHHNILTISRELFELYLEIAKSNNRNLAVRPPRILPLFSSWLFVNLVASGLRNNPAFKFEASSLQSAFEKYLYTGKRALRIRTALYGDMRYYSRKGKLVNKKGKDKADKHIKRAVARFGRMVAKTKQSHIKQNALDHNTSIVEFIFHLGDPDAKASDISDAMVSHYPGVSTGYFQNRIIESRGLQALVASRRENVFENLASWKDCRAIRFKREIPKPLGSV